MAVYDWLNANDITNISTNVLPNTSNGGEISIAEAIKNNPALYDSVTGNAIPGTFEIASNDGSFANSGHPDASLFETNRVGTQQIAENGVLEGRISFSDYKGLSTEGSPSIGGWTSHQEVAAEVITAKTGVPTTWDSVSGNFVQEIDGNPANNRYIAEGDILKSSGSYSNIGEFLGASGTQAEATNWISVSNDNEFRRVVLSACA